MQQESQNNLALDRTVLANERTYAAWIRTGLTALVTGLGAAKFLNGLLPSWSIHALSGILIGFSAIAFLVAAWRYRHLHVKISHLDVDIVPRGALTVVSLVLAACSLIALAGLWLFRA